MTSAPLNGSSLTVKALEQSDEGAFKELLNTLVKRGTLLSIFNHDTPVKEGSTDTLTKINVKVAKEHAPVDMWVYKDAQPVTYNRVKLADVAAKYPPTILTDFPVSHKELFSKYLVKNGLYNRGEQIVDGTVTAPGTVLLTMKEEAFLIVGGYGFIVKQSPKYLAEVVTVTQLNVFDEGQNMTGDSMVQLVNNVNALNAATLPRPIKRTEVKAGVPVVLNEYNDVNTEVALIGDGSEVFLDQVLLTYHRVNFSWLLGGTQMVLSGPSAVTTQVLLEKVRAKTGFTIDYDDFVEQAYDPVPSGEMQTLTVNMHDTSLRFVGELTIDYTAE